MLANRKMELKNIPHTEKAIESDGKGKDFNDFKALYDKVFEVRRAVTRQDITESHRIRYQVYCMENQFEDPEKNPGGQEIDEFDKHSIHTLLIHRHTGFVVGSVRVVLPQADNLDDCLPIQRICDLKNIDDNYSPLKTAEISRFCISKKMRKRVCDTSQYLGLSLSDVTEEDCYLEDDLTRRTIPYAALGLVKAVIDIGQEHDMRNLYASMEPFLIRSLSMLGIPSQYLGPVVDYHGKRQPVKMSLMGAFETSLKSNHNTWQIISNNGEFHEKEKAAIERSKRLM